MKERRKREARLRARGISFSDYFILPEFDDSSGFIQNDSSRIIFEDTNKLKAEKVVVHLPKNFFKKIQCKKEADFSPSLLLSLMAIEM